MQVNSGFVKGFLMQADGAFADSVTILLNRIRKMGITLKVNTHIHWINTQCWQTWLSFDCGWRLVHSKWFLDTTMAVLLMKVCYWHQLRSDPNLLSLGAEV